MLLKALQMVKASNSKVSILGLETPNDLAANTEVSRKSSRIPFCTLISLEEFPSRQSSQDGLSIKQAINK
jgi:hypothetical protein